jgi:tRNA A37 methylthiotransferase MiaB
MAVDLIGATERVQVDDIMSVRETASHLIDGFGTRSRAYVQVQNGCDHRCTFCIIPLGAAIRGRSPPVWWSTRSSGWWIAAITRWC